MKLLFCIHCRDTISITHDNLVRKCRCGVVAGKYLEDKITAVITKHSTVFGIDNNSFLNAFATVDKVLNDNIEGFDLNKRYDFFFTGWIPTIPGEVIVVEDINDVYRYDYHQKKSWTSQNPTTDINESNSGVIKKKKCDPRQSWKSCIFYRRWVRK